MAYMRLSGNGLVFLGKRGSLGQLIDRGANGGIAGPDVTFVSDTGRTLTLTGIDNHQVRDLRIIHGAVVVRSDHGEIILHLREYSYMPTGKTIHSPLQLEAYGCVINDKAPTVNKEIIPSIVTPHGYKIPLRITEGLPYFDSRPVKEEDWESLPHEFLTRGKPWDPSKYDTTVEESWYSSQTDLVAQRLKDAPYDRFGNFKDIDKPVKPDEVSGETEPSNVKFKKEVLDEPAPMRRKEVSSYLAEAIADELVDEMLELRDDRNIYYIDMSDTIRQCHWVEFNGHFSSPLDHLPTDPKPQVHVSTRRQRGVILPEINYDDTKRRPRKDTQPKKVTFAPQEDLTSEPASTTVEAENTPEPTPDETPPTVEEPPSEHDPPEDSRTDFNNPSKSTKQTDTHDVVRSTGPYLGKLNLDVEQVRKFFLGMPAKVVQKTIENTTMLGTRGAIGGRKLWRRIKSPNPALNIHRRNEPVSTDTIYGPVPAIDNGSTAAQFFAGRKSGYVDIIPCGKSDKSFPKILEEHIRRLGAMDSLISDNAKAQISERVKDILRTYGIKQHRSEPENKNTNPAERSWRDIKHDTEYILNSQGAPPDTWLLACQHAAFVRNHTSKERLNWRTPYEWLFGVTPDITVLVQFLFYEPVYYKVYDDKFPSDPNEALGRYVGVATEIGNPMTFKIRTESGQIIYRSEVRSAAKYGMYRNLRADERAPSLRPKDPNTLVNVKGEKYYTRIDPSKPTEGDTSAEQTFLKTAMEDAINQGGSLPTIDVTDIIGKTYITLPNDHGEQFRATIVDVLPTGETTPDRKEALLKFRSQVGGDAYEDIMTYGRMLQWIEDDDRPPDHFNVEAILAHRKIPKGVTHEDGSRWQLQVLWEGGATTWEPINTIASDDSITVAAYAEKNDLLNTDGWKRFKNLTRDKKISARLIHQARLKNFRGQPKYKYGVQVPRDHREAMILDERNNNNRWAKAAEKELQQILDYDTFKSLGKGAPVPEGHTLIPCHLVFDQKASGAAKGRLVAGGHRTSTPAESTYSGVVSLLGIRVVTFLAELNGLELWGTDVGNAYLESYTSEKVCFIAGPEFGEYEGHTCIIVKALYGLKSSGRNWHDKLFDVLTDLGFFPSKAEPDIWMRNCGDHYEYLAVYVDDLLIASRNPQAIIDSLEKAPNNFKLKGTGPLECHLGCDFFRDSDGTMCFGPKRYIERMADAYIRMYGTPPNRKVTSPLEKNDHPELDTSDLLDAEGIQQYQSLIGTLQWCITLGRFDIATAVMSMSSFRAAPRKGHLERVKRICGYLYKMNEGCIRVRTETPDYSDLPEIDVSWLRSVYGKVEELNDPDAPEPLGKPVRTSTFKDANLFHDHVTGRAVSGILHFLNQMPFDWYSKKQATVETATYGSEFGAGRTAVQQIRAHRQFLRYLGVPIEGKAYLFGDNESVIKSGSIPHSMLSKRHLALAYHYVREAVASGVIAFHHIPGEDNPADILSKHWGYTPIYHNLLKPILFYQGNTHELLEEE